MDDRSKDQTQAAARQYQKKYRRPVIKFFTSKKTGLAQSRNQAVKIARGKYLAFLDDDSQAEKHWLEKAAVSLIKVNPQPEGITGPITPFYLQKKPVWFKDIYEGDIKGYFSRFLKKGETFSGPNMILKRELIREFGGFAEEIDMKEDIIMVGEETRLFERIWAKNPNNKLLYYSKEVKIFHVVHPYKMKVSYKLKRWFATGQSFFYRNYKNSFINDTFLVIKVTGYFLFSLIALLFFFHYRYYQNWLIEKVGPLAFFAGFCSSLFHLPIKMIQSSRL